MTHKKYTVVQCLEEVGLLGRFQIVLSIIWILNSILSGYVTFQFQSLSIAPSVSNNCNQFYH